MRYGLGRDLHGDHELGEVDHRDLPGRPATVVASRRECRDGHRCVGAVAAIVSRVPRVTGDSITLREGKLKLFASCLGVLCLILVWRSADAMTVTPADSSIGVGQTQQFTASGALTPAAVAAGGLHTCMRLPDGTVQCWGRNNFGQLGNGDGNLTSSSVPVAVRGLTTATGVVTGDAHACALLGDGTVQCWGVGDSGQRGDGTFNNISTVPVAVVGMGGAGHLTNAVAVAARGYHSCALLGDGTVRCWGRNVDGQLGDGTTAPLNCSPGSCGSSAPVQVVGITSAVAVIAGGYHTCALLADGTAWCWGRSDDGQLGNGARASASTPVPVTNLTGVTAMTAGFYHTCALLPNGTVWCWGRNDDGQLGDGTTLGRPAPVQVAGITGALAVSGGAHHPPAPLSDGTGACRGGELRGPLRGGAAPRPATP